MKKFLLPLALCALFPVLAGAADSAMSNFVADGVKPWYYNNSVIDNAHGKLFRLSVDVTAVGDGDTTLSLWTGHANNSLSKVEERAVTATGTQTFEYTSPREMGDWEYFRIKMEQTVGDATAETWLPALNDSKNWAYLADGQVYEWTGGDSGGAWEDAANWRSTGEVDFVGTPTGYPASESVGGAVFPAGTNVVTLGSRKVVPAVRTAAGTALALRSASGRQELEIDAWAGAGFAGLSSFAIDGVDVFWSPEIGPTRTDAVYSVTNGGHWYSRLVWPQGSGATFRVASGSTLELGEFWGGSVSGLVDIEGTVSVTGVNGYWAAYKTGTGSKTRLRGDAPALVFSSNAGLGGAEGADGTLEFVVPAGGWEQVPVRGAAGGTAQFAAPYRGSGNLVVNVDPDSPAATTDGVTDAVLVSWPGGFDTTHLVYGTLPNPATDSFYVQNNPNTNVPELHVRIFGQAQGEADPTVTAVSVGDLTRSGATVSAAVMLGGAASSATVSLLLSVNGGAESVATNETVSTSGMVVFPVAGLPSGATCRFRVQAVNSYGRSAVSDPVEVRLLARYAEFTVAGEGVSLSRANGDTVAAFTASGTFTVLRGGEAEVLIVAGGGAGGTAGQNYGAAGGGAGGVVHLENLWLDAGDYSVVVGTGGAPSSSRSVLGKNGGDSSFWSYVATGGGAGCCPYTSTAAIGGSGGGGVGNAFGNDYGANAGIAGQGHDGGRGSSGWIPGGGGGAGAAGAAGATGQSGAGGAGLSFVFGKTTYEVGGGGGAGAYNTEPGGATHGGGAGGAAGSSGANGAAQTGGGGGGGGKTAADTPGGAGGSGLVLVRMHTGLDGTLLLVH